MGRWGECLFEGDTDLDVASFIAEDAGIELFHYDAPDLNGKGLEATRQRLESGVLTRLFEQYATTEDPYHLVTKDLRLVFLGTSPSSKPYTKVMS